MPRRVLVERDGSTFDLVEVPAPNEHHLQEIMKAQPQLIPADDLGSTMTCWSSGEKRLWHPDTSICCASRARGTSY